MKGHQNRVLLYENPVLSILGTASFCVSVFVSSPKYPSPNHEESKLRFEKTNAWKKNWLFVKGDLSKSIMHRFLVLKEIITSQDLSKKHHAWILVYLRKTNQSNFSMVIFAWWFVHGRIYLSKNPPCPKSPSFAKCRSQSPCPWEACSSARSCHLQATPPNLLRRFRDVGETSKEDPRSWQTGL